MRVNYTVQGPASLHYQASVTTEEYVPLSVEEILESCDEVLGKIFLPGNESRPLPAYMHCQHCNISSEELETLVLSGVCTQSDFSSYLPLIYQMYASIFIIALLGNSLVVYTIATNRKMHTVTNLFIANLAVGDLLIMVFCVPFSVASIIVLQYWPFGESLCILTSYCQAVSIFVSAYTLVAISIDRYLAIIYPLRPRMTRLQAKVIIGVVWILALLTTLPIAIFSRLDPTDRRVYLMYGWEVCREVWPNENLETYYTMTLMVLQYFLPLLVLIFTYSRIAWEVWGKNSNTSSKGQGYSVHNVDKGRRLLRKSATDHSPAKMIRMTLTVVLVYSLCWLPFNLLSVTLDFNSDLYYWPHIHHLWFVFHWLAMSHTCYNPLILCWMNTKFREGYLNVLYRLMPCCRSRISQYLLKLRQTSGLQRAHTYSTALGSSRTSRNHRYPDDPRVRRDSTCSNAVFTQVPQSSDIPLKVIRGHSCEPATNGVHSKANGRVRKYSEPPFRPTSYSSHQSVAPTMQESNTTTRLGYLEVSSPTSPQTSNGPPKL